jgi:hypothetical protein
MTWLLVIIGTVLLLWAAIIVAFSKPLWRRWREPVLKYPVLVIESDDWGAGPLAQGPVLGRLAALLAGIRDASGRPALMTLGVILEVPDGARIAQTGEYSALNLLDSRMEPVLAAMQHGITAGVFIPHLHGQSH